MEALSPQAEKFRSLLEAEPAVSVGFAILGMVDSAILMLPLLGVGITPAEQLAILTFVSSVITSGTIIVRSRVTPVAKAQDKIEEAYQATPGVDEKPTL